MIKTSMSVPKKALKKYTLLASLIAAAATMLPAQATTLKISHVRPQGTVVDNDIKQLSNELKAATEGDLKLRVYAANALGDYTLVQERISVGAIDMALQPASTSTDRKMQIGLLPFLANNWEEAQNIYGSGAPVRQAMEDLFAKQDITLLAAYPVYFGGISLNRSAVDAGNPDVSKGIKLRVPPIKSFQLLADNVGYIGSPLPFSEAFTAVQTGVVDGVIGSGAEGYYASFRDVTKTYIPLNTHFEIWYLMINSERFEDLDDQEKNALATAAAEFESRRWDAAQLDQKANEQKLVDAGATIVEMTPAQLKLTADKVRSTVWPQIINDIGSDWSQPILEKALN
ncbi:TRAP transporter substrate-binding protein DctP [Vibrio brasiliensis]|jgi:TRAP-type C4-dicarboxylate transport system substrate-binding protein|uniref:TRAP transporter substrate-binding protein DctP n=1 Tax=Vibrio brasiliensis TaxID=170652 RepID=UPI001EFC3188|nr:TRAP transporter substrate-binding protein DctP [Vibrio brasiliensis]MCG9751844.1 TRAP transporter substrate-binding protein DctP [Vibrio brasiliensis]MCG9782846.1 TRAP transporter substrate-binding protein DctP [Vibrio brasiliensis]